MPGARAVGAARGARRVGAAGRPVRVRRFPAAAIVAQRQQARARADRARDARSCSTRRRTRLAETLADIAVVCPEWRVCVGREVTKTFEEFRTGRGAELAAEIAGEKPLGECTLVRRRRRSTRRRRASPARPRPTTTSTRCCAHCSRRVCRRRRWRRRCEPLPGHRPQRGVRARARARSRATAADDDHACHRQGPDRRRVEPDAFAEFARAVREDCGRRRHRRRPLRVPPGVGRPGPARDRYRRARRADGRDRAARRRASRRRAVARISCSCAPRSKRCRPSSRDVADEVYVQLPWGALLEGIVLARRRRARRASRRCAGRARGVAVTLNGEIWLDSTPARYEHATGARLPSTSPRWSRPGSPRAGIELDAGALPRPRPRRSSCRRRGRGGSVTAATHPRFVQFDGVAA